MLSRLIGIQQSEIIGKQTLKAEIPGELGSFEECPLPLSYQFDTGYERAVGFIKKLAEGSVQGVRAFAAAKFIR